MLMVGIPLLFDVILIWWPTASSILLSFTDWDGIGDLTPQNFIGLKNYQFLFTGYTLFWPAFMHNVIWLAWLTFIATPIGILFAVLLDRELRGNRIYQSVFFLPVVLSLVVVGFIWELQFNPTEGFINTALGVVKSGHIIDWLGNPHLNLYAILIATSWRHIGYIMVIYLAGLKSVDPTLREAAKVDGANEVQTFLRVVFPVMAPINVVIAVITAIEALRAFDIAFIINQGKNGLELLSIVAKRAPEPRQLPNVLDAGRPAVLLPEHTGRRRAGGYPHPDRRLDDRVRLHAVQLALQPDRPDDLHRGQPVAAPGHHRPPLPHLPQHATPNVRIHRLRPVLVSAVHRQQPSLRPVSRRDADPCCLSDRLRHLRAEQLHEDDLEGDHRVGHRRRCTRPEDLVEHHPSALPAGPGGDGDPVVHLHLQRLLLGPHLDERGQQAAHHERAQQHAGRVLHQRQPHRRRCDAGCDPADSRFHLSAKAVHRRADARLDQGLTTLPTLPHIIYGGDYNPDQWPEETWAEDVRLMQEAGVNLVSLAIFAWSRIQPDRDSWDFDWLDRIISMLYEGGVRVNLATATASPPPWLSHAHPEMLPVLADGTRLWHGARQHYCPSSPVYRVAARRLVEAMAERYGHHPALAMWHVGNEFGCHVPACYCDVSAQGFRAWLKERYGSIDDLNRAWGTDFWSQRYSDWEEIIPPRRTPTWPNPSQQLDYMRFSSDALLECYELEHKVLSRLTPDIPVTTNFMSFFKPLDYWKWAKNEDVVSNDSYPDPSDPESSMKAAMAGDLMRSLGGGRPWILMEQTTNRVNWREVNAPKPPGLMRLWSYQALARGADGVMFFQWRQSRAGAEKFHSAMVPHGPVESSPAWHEVVRLGKELRGLDIVGDTRAHAEVAILFDWESWWGLDRKSV